MWTMVNRTSSKIHKSSIFLRILNRKNYQKKTFSTPIFHIFYLLSVIIKLIIFEKYTTWKMFTIKILKNLTFYQFLVFWISQFLNFFEIHKIDIGNEIKMIKRSHCIDINVYYYYINVTIKRFLQNFKYKLFLI